MNIKLDSYMLSDRELDSTLRADMQYNRIQFEFPDGFTTIPLIEECRALNALDVSIPDNFDLMYDITMQMLTGKLVKINYIDSLTEITVSEFLVTDRYMNLRGVDLIDEYPVVVNWLVEFIAGYLGKKFPRSLRNLQETMNERGERMKNLQKKEVKVRTSFQNR